MKKIFVFFFLILIFCVGFVVYFKAVKTERNNTLQKSNIPAAANSGKIVYHKKQKSLFVPYWGLNGEIKKDEYDELIYFGVAAGKEGISRDESGYANIDKFIRLTGEDTKKFLTVRMIDSDTNSHILKNKETQEKIINESIRIAKDYSFQGIVLDFEINGIPFDSFLNSIMDFYKGFYKSTKDEKLLFYTTLYGDTFYRIRPYDVNLLSENCDRILIMAYDLHKAGGDPGPNFPLKGKQQYGYDFENMIGDFLKQTSENKIGVVFGLYGYDWEVDEKGKSKGAATAMSYNKIKEKFLSSCSYKDCLKKRDENASETKITYKDGGENHVVWFEDMKSVFEKQKYLDDKGINYVSFWAYSYF